MPFQADVNRGTRAIRVQRTAGGTLSSINGTYAWQTCVLLEVGTISCQSSDRFGNVPSSITTVLP